MGEAKRRKGQEGDQFGVIQKMFCDHGIDTSNFGFYDSVPFLQAEEIDPLFLECYARWVAFRPRDLAYEAHVHDVVPRLTNLLASTLHADGMMGGCIAAAGMMSRMLDRLGVWSFNVHGCLTLEAKAQDLWRGFATIDDVDFEGGLPGHSWIVAPPYCIVDTSLILQRLDGDRIQPFVPATLLCETDFRIAKPQISDIVAARIRSKYAQAEGGYDPLLHYRLEPRLRQFGRAFPAIEVTRGELQLRYIPTAIRATDVPLELINSDGTLGRPAIQTWRETIAPAFGIKP